jgi:hypothetical protein
MIWKPLDPIVYRGFRESPKADIAAYALDKLLQLEMVPPVVERELQGHRGAATFWVENIRSMADGGSPGISERAHLENQLTRMRMFDNLIANGDRNAANILRDAAWNLILLDHSRSFGTRTELRHGLHAVDRDFWARIDKLTPKQLEASLRPWIEQEQITALLQRRERMRAGITKR